jgi:uncharacterized protein (TIGR00645 family)
MEKRLEAMLLGMRWLLLPLYLALLLVVLAVYALVGREIIHLWAIVLTGTETELVLIILGVLDLVLVANLLVMVAISSYESFISRIDTASDASKPEWLGKLDSGNVKVKVAVSVAMISAIHLLRAFLRDDAGDRLIVLAGVHMVFVLSTLAVALVDRTARHAGEDAHG